MEIWADRIGPSSDSNLSLNFRIYLFYAIFSKLNDKRDTSIRFDEFIPVLGNKGGGVAKSITLENTCNFIF